MKTECIIQTMAQIVEKKVKLYKSDFYKFDIRQMFRIGGDSEFVWFVRDTGTHLLSDDDDEHVWNKYYPMYKSCNDWFYHVKMHADGSGEVTLSEKQCDRMARKMGVAI